MRKKWIVFWTVLSCLAALLTAVVPAGQSIAAQWQRLERVSALRQSMAQTTDEQRRLQWNLAKWYNRNLNQETPEDEIRQAYGSILAFANGAMGLLSIPQLNWEGTIYHGTQAQNVCHDPGSPFPTGAEGEKIQLILRNQAILRGLRPGMKLELHCLDRVLTFHVSEQTETAGGLILRDERGENHLFCAPGEGAGDIRPSGNILWGPLLAAAAVGVLPVLFCRVDQGLRKYQRKRKSKVGNMEKANAGSFFLNLWL